MNKTEIYVDSDVNTSTDANVNNPGYFPLFQMMWQYSVPLFKGESIF